MDLVRSKWELYRSLVLPPDALPAQVSECQKAFYAGANCLFDLLMEDIEPGQGPTDRDVQKLQNIRDELGEFVNYMLRESMQ
jgi:hypothetical protein